jgi:hypothetical protein
MNFFDSHFLTNILFVLLALNEINKSITRVNANPLIMCNTNEERCNDANDVENILRKRPTHKELCKFCDITLPIVRYLIAKNDTEHFHEIVSYICQELKLADKIVCDMVVKTYQVRKCFFNNFALKKFNRH